MTETIPEYPQDRAELMASKRNGTNLVQLIYDPDSRGFYVHHREHGKLVCYDFIANNTEDACYLYEEYLQTLGGEL